MNDLRELLSDHAASAPPDDLDVASVLVGGRRRVRRRRLAALGGTTLGTAAVVATAALVPFGGTTDLQAAGVPRPHAPLVRLSDASSAVEGEDYRLLVSHTNEDLDSDNGQYFDGVTDDGLVLFRDGPRMEQPEPRFALMDPATGHKQWLPSPGVGGLQTWPVELGEDRLVLVTAEGGAKVALVAHVYDRASGQWDELRWAGLPKVDGPTAQVGPDGRLYVRVPATRGEPPEGGWPTGPDGEADDADADGDTYRLWSASLTDPSDVRDEGLTLGSLAFTDSSMVWTDATNGDAGRVHVRDLDTGEERAFDPRSGERCNLLSFGATEERVVLGQYCGTYDDGVRDDRVQVLDTDGGQVVTLQGSDIEGWLASPEGDGIVAVTARGRGTTGTYLYDLGSGELVRVSGSLSSWTSGGPVPEGMFLWNTPVNRGRGMTEHLGELAG